MSTNLRIRQFAPKEIELMLRYWDKLQNIEDVICAYSVQIEDDQAIYQIPTEHELEAIVETASQLRTPAYLGDAIAELIWETSFSS